MRIMRQESAKSLHQSPAVDQAEAAELARQDNLSRKLDEAWVAEAAMCGRSGVQR